MDIGWHFELNRSSSILQEGFCLFDYLAYEPKLVDGEKRYPVYLVFTDDGVHFYLQYLDEHDGTTDHFSGCILFLPMDLDRDFRTELSTTLNAAFDDNSLAVPACSLRDRETNTYKAEWFSSSKNTSESVRQLLLDFIFEMEHGTVFQHDPFFDEVYAALHDHYLFSAIVAKSEYLYYRGLIRNDENHDALTRSFMVRAERRWMDILVDRRSDLVFHESPWFEDTVEEMSMVYESELTGVDVCMDALGKDLPLEKKKKEENLKRMAEQSADMAVLWFMGKYRPDAALCVALGKGYRTVVVIQCILLVALAALLALRAICTAPEALPVLRIGIWLLLLSILLVYIVFSNLPKRRGRVGLHTFISLLLPRLFAAIAAAWMTVGLGDVIAKIDDTPLWAHLPYASLITSTSVIVSAFLLLFLWYSVSRILPFHRWYTRIAVTLWIYILSFIYSVFIGAGLMHLFGGESFLMSYDPDRVKALLVFSFISMFVGVFIQFLVQDRSVSSSDL